MCRKTVNNKVGGFTTFLLGVIFLLPPTAIPGEVTHSSVSLIHDITVDKEVFTPSAGDENAIRFSLTEAARVTLKVFDFDQDLISVVAEDKSLEKGSHVLSWNGRDSKGEIVPDEAYFFTVEAVTGSEKTVCDPTASSGGITHEIERVNVLPEQQMIEYQLPEKGRVSVKAGIVNGPLLSVPVDWSPRASGPHKEKWDGMDQDGLISILSHPRYQVRVSYYTLPENTIIASGNSQVTYDQYKQAKRPAEARNSSSLSAPRSILASPLYATRLLFTKSPPVDIVFPEASLNNDGIPVFKEKVSIKVDLPEEWKTALSSRKYEIYFFFDHEFLTEEPQMRVPYETVLDVAKYKPGCHALSVNILGPGGQIGIKTKRVTLQ